MGMQIEEVQVGSEGLDTKFSLNGKEVKLTKLKSVEELAKAHSYLSAIICEQFFEVAKMKADKDGIEVFELFENEEHLENAMKKYISAFMEQLVKSAIVHTTANYELFRSQKASKVDA